jgi:hypothetical protein
MGLTAQAIGQWTIKAGAPARREGSRVFVQWPQFARWREQELCKQAVAEATAGMRRQLDAKGKGNWVDRKGMSEARKAEIEVELLERSVVTIEEASAVTEKLLTDLRGVLVPLPRTAAPKLVGAKTVVEMEQRLHAEVVRLMEVMASPAFGVTDDTPATEEAA